MADDFAIGKALQIPDSVLTSINALDAKLNNIAKNAEAMADAFNKAFASIDNDASKFNKRLAAIEAIMTNLSKAQGANGLSALASGFNSTNIQAEKATNSITKAANSLNQLTNPAISSSIKSMEEQIRKLAEDIRLYYQAIDTGKKTYIDFGQSGLKEAVPLVNSLMRGVIALGNAQSQLKNSGSIFKSYMDDLNGVSLSARRQSDELKRLNDYYREMEKESAQAAKEAERAAERQAKAAEKAAKEAEKAAERQIAAQAKLDSRLRKSNYQSYITSTEGALRTADKATTYTQRAQAIKNLNAAINNLRSTDANYEKDLQRLSNAYRNLTAQQRVFEQNLGRISTQQSNAMNISEQLRRRIALAFSVSQITMFLTAIRDVTGEFELQNAALRSILGNKNQADMLYQQVQDLAVKSPFTVKELTTYTKSLAAYGLEYENLYDTLKRLADVSAGLGVDMQRIILAFGQVRAANVLRGTETRQFSEAGLNILKELANYYSEVEKRAVSLSEVQDRQFRKMISYEDVAEVFRRITSEGGMFYQMQERQSETIAGMMSNLEDTRDLMYKAIGDENREVIVAFINAMKTLMSNWRIFANLVKAGGVTMALYTVKVIAAAAANGKLTTSALTAAAAQRGFNGAMASSALAIKNFAKFSVNPWMLAITGITTAALMIDSHRKAVERARQEYDLLNNTIEDNKASFDSLSAKITESSNQIKTATKNLASTKKGTDDYQKAQIELNNAISLQAGHLDELKQKYPEVYEQIVKNADGTIDLAHAVEQYNQTLRDSQLLNFYMEDTEGFFGSGIIENLKEYQRAVDESAALSNKAELAIRDMIASLRQYTAQKVGTWTDRDGKQYEEISRQLDKIAKSTDSVTEKYKQLFSLAKTYVFSYNDNSTGLVFSQDAIKAVQDYAQSLGDVNDITDDVADNVIEQSDRIRAAFNLNTKEGKKRASEAAEAWIRSLQGIGDKARDLAAQQFTLQLGIQVNWRISDKEEKAMYDDWRQTAVDMANTSVYTPLLKNISSIRDFGNELKKIYKSNKEEIEANTDALKNQNVLRDSEVEKLKQTNQQRKAENTDIENVAKALNINLQYEEDINKALRERRKREKEALDDFKKRLGLLDDAEKEYTKLREYNPVEESAQRVKEMFKDTDIAGLIKSMPGFEPKDMLKGYDKFLAEAKRLGKEATEALQDKQRPILRKIEVEVDKDSLDKVNKDIEKAFYEYNLSKELLSSGLDKYEINAVFGKQITSLKELMDYLEKTVKPKLKGQGLEQEKLWEETYKNITKLQGEELEAQTKQYAKYLAQQYSESTQIILKLQSDIEKVQSNPKFTETMKKSIIDNLQKEARAAQQKLNWESFTGSDYYIEMFKDLDYVSSQALETMRLKIEKIKKSFKDLPAADVKEMVDALSKIEEEQISRAPFKAISEGIDSIVNGTKTRRDLEKEIQGLLLQQQITMLKLQNAELSVNNAREKYQKAVSQYGEGSDEAIKAKFQLDVNETNLNALRDNLNNINTEIGDVKNSWNDLSDNQKNAIGGFKAASEQIQMLTNSFATLKSGMESVFNLSDAASDTMDSLIEFGNGLSSTLDSASTLATGIAFEDPIMAISGGMQTLGNLFSTIGSIFSIGDKKREREIQREIELIEDLQKQYEKLSEKIQNAYSIDTLRGAEEAAEYNLRKQIESYQDMIAAEEDKKKTDDDRIKEWKNQIEELEKELQDLEAQRLESLGGFGSDERVKSAAQEFAEVWLDAYKETGDGLDALNSKWDEYIQNIVASKLMMAGTEKFLKPIMDFVDGALDDYNWSPEDQKELQEYIDTYMPILNEFWGKIADSLGTSIGDGGDTLTGLQKGIEGITADQADALAAILESVRYFVADTNMLFRQFLSVYQTIENTASNPMLIELQTQTALIQSINTLLGSVIRNVPTTGRAIKVQIV